MTARAASEPRQLNDVGMRALAAGDAARALTAFAAAAELDPNAPALWLNLAKAQRLLNDDSGERAALERVLALDAINLTALIRKAELLQRRGELAAATQLWAGVLAVAPPRDQRSPALAELLDPAEAFVAERNRAFAAMLDATLLPARAAIGGDQRRFDAAIDTALGRRRIFANECAGLHFPFLPADEFFPRAHFPWIAALETHTAAIRAEVTALLADGSDGVVPYVAMEPGVPANKWTPLDHSLDWSAYYLWKYGNPIASALAQCPATAAALANVPAADLPGRAPTAFFSILKPHTRIPPHTGVSNTRAIIHLPLIVPAACGFRVGGETRRWVEGEAFGFDDTIEHEAWNDSDRVRVILILDVWNPHITVPERELLRDFYRAADAGGFYPPPTE